MAERQKRPARATGSGLSHTKLQLASYDIQDTAPEAFRQASIDVVGLLAARSGVAASTVRAHLAAFGMEARS